MWSSYKYIRNKICARSETLNNTTKDLSFILGGKVIEIVKDYTFLGLYFSNAGSLKKSIENLKAVRHLGALERLYDQTY